MNNFTERKNQRKLAEVRIKPAFGQPGARGNVIDPRFLEAVRGKLEQRRLQELRNAFAGR